MCVDTLIEEHKEKVESAATHYYKLIPEEKKGLIEWDDLCSAGYEALVEAAKRFDPDAGVKFMTYAYQWIDPAIKKEILFYLGPEVLSYDAYFENLIGGEGDISEEYFKRDDSLEADQVRSIREAMDRSGLSEKEKDVCCRIYGIGQEEEKNLKRIAGALHITEMQVRRLKQSAESKLRKLRP